MAYFDLIIIYLACGAPFGVYELTITRSTGNVALRGLTTILVWPIYAIGHLKKFLEPDTRLQIEVARIRTDLEKAAFPNASSAEIFEFRQVYQRLTGLAGAVIERPSPPYELFTETAHPDPRLASVCLARRNRTRVDFHLDRSKQDLIRVIDAFQPDRHDTVASLIAELGAVIGSPDLARERLDPEVFAKVPSEHAAAMTAIDR